MDQETIDYRRQELIKVAEGGDRKIKIISSTGETKWMSINRYELSGVIFALMGVAP